MKQLTGVVKDYAWGSATAIPGILGTAPDGSPQAEYWLGDHPLAPARVEGRTLDQLLVEQPELLGEASLARFGPRLPFMVKILAAEQQLSLQAHPSRTQAEAGFAQEDAAGIPRNHPVRTYRDAWPKPELLCALGPFEALYGFRSPEVSADLLAGLQVEGLADTIATLRDDRDPTEALRRACGTFFHLPRGGLVDTVVAAAERSVAVEGELGTLARTATELAAQYPGDPGILVALLMNRTTLQRFEALYVPAGMMHAYTRGTGVEVMGSSDNVLRGGLTGKHVDVDGLAAVVDFRPCEPIRVRHEEVAPGLWHYVTPTPEFGVWRAAALPGPVRLPAAGLARIVLVVEGRLQLDGPEGPSTLRCGDAVLVGADEDPTLSGAGTAFIAAPGI